MPIFYIGANCPEGEKMPKQIALSKGDFLRLVDTVDFEKRDGDPDSEDIVVEVEVYAEGTE